LDVSANVVSAGLGFNQELILVTTTADPQSSYAGADVSPGWASFPHSAAPSPYGVDVRILSDQTERTVRVRDLPVSRPTFQALPDGGLLAVGARSSWKDGDAFHNAVLIDVAGDIASTFCLGDGIAHTQVDPLGRIWVGYFDEGVFGNFGWGGPGREPLGSSGLVCWSLDGRKLWSFEAPEGVGPIDDCYALNVTGHEAWACYYSDFPIVRVGDDWRIKAWAGGPSGAHAIAVTDGAVALVGGYRRLHDRLVLCVLGTDSSVASTSTWRLQLPGDQDLPLGTLVLARGQTVTAIVDGAWYRVNIADLGD
jgi:hypothetical protein